MLKKTLLIIVALFIGANVAVADLNTPEGYCDDAVRQSCLLNAAWGNRLWADVYHPLYPACPIRVCFRERRCTDCHGNYWVEMRIEWWEITKDYPNDCLQLFNDLWDPVAGDWDQLLYEEMLTEVDNLLSAKIADNIFTNPMLPPDYYDCENNEFFVHLVTTKAACYSLVLFDAGINPDGESCNQLVIQQVPCGDDYGCCYQHRLYCRRNGIPEVTILDEGYIPGNQSGCGDYISASQRQSYLDQLNAQYPNCYYEVMHYEICRQSCDFTPVD